MNAAAAPSVLAVTRTSLRVTGVPDALSVCVTVPDSVSVPDPPIVLDGFVHVRTSRVRGLPPPSLTTAHEAPKPQAARRRRRATPRPAKAVSSLLIGQSLVWPLGCELYLPRDWTDDAARRAAVDLPARVRFREKWRIALGQVRAALTRGIDVTAVVSDADYGSVVGFRRGLERLGLRYAVAIRSNLLAWQDRARRARSVADIAKRIPAREWRRVCWGHGTKGPLAARFVALRGRPARSRGEHWLLCERSLGKGGRKFYLLNLDASASLKALVTLARCRWPIEQLYRELKDELGWDHFEGRSFRGWTHHSVLTAMGFTFLQLERRRSPDGHPPMLPEIRFWVREIMAMLYVASRRDLLSLAISFQRDPPLRI